MIQISELNARMAKYEHECGCTLGAQFMTAALAISLFITIRQYRLISQQFVFHLPIIVLVSIAAAGIGKLSGIFYAKYKYKQLSKQLTTYLARAKQEETHYAGNMEESSRQLHQERNNNL